METITTPSHKTVASQGSAADSGLGSVTIESPLDVQRSTPEDMARELILSVGLTVYPIAVAVGSVLLGLAGVLVFL